MADEIYVSTDVEGRRPHPRSALDAQLRLRPRTGRTRPWSAPSSRNLETLPDATPDPKTAAWWEGQPRPGRRAGRSRARRRTRCATTRRGLRGLPGKPVFVGYPAAYDFMFVYWYLIRFVGQSPFSHSALDIKTFAMAVMGTEYRGSSKEQMPAEWFDPVPHTHVALDDAIGQGALFCNMLAASRAKPPRGLTRHARRRDDFAYSTSMRRAPALTLTLCASLFGLAACGDDAASGGSSSTSSGGGGATGSGGERGDGGGVAGGGGPGGGKRGVAEVQAAGGRT
jgi:hypothetical protein